MKKKWISKEEEALNKGLFLPEAQLPQLIKRLLLSRGFLNSSEIEKVFSSKLADLADPFLIEGMEKATDRILQAFEKKEKICIYADFDLDGTSGLALFFDGLQQLGFGDLIYYQPKRLSEGYGFHQAAVSDLAGQGVKLIITVDVGITAFEACVEAQKHGIDIIITDHHQPAAQLPKALVILNPNQVGDKSGLGYLCGAGVAFYLLRALKRVFVEKKIILEHQLDLKSLLDFFTIGTLTDLVPLVQDNRILVRYGLLQLAQTQRPGLRALLKELKLLDRPLNGQDVAIRFAPKLNALSRMENGILPIDIFLIRDQEKADSLIQHVLDNNEDRVQLQQGGELEAKEFLRQWPHSDFIFVTSKSFHRGVVGLIATKLSQEYNVPAFVGSESDDGLIVGSARSPQKEEFSVLTALEAASKALNRFGGHHSAAGFELNVEQKDLVIQSLVAHFVEMENKPEEVPTFFDLELSNHDLNENFMKWMDALGPFGQGFPIPTFVIRNQTVKSVSKLKGIHLKFGFENLQALYFSPPSEIQIPTIGQSVDILGELQWNYFGGKKSIQFIIRDLMIKEKDLFFGVKNEISRSVEFGS